jgi:CheY-like chemotaxis protein
VGPHFPNEAERDKLRPMSKLLIVDSDEAYLNTASERLRGEGHTVDTCATPAEVPSHVLKGEYDMLLIDYDLPGLNVGDLLPLLRNVPSFRQTRVVLLSSVDDEERRATAKQYECEFLMKGSESEALTSVVRHSFASRPPGLPS